MIMLRQSLIAITVLATSVSMAAADSVSRDIIGGSGAVIGKININDATGGVLIRITINQGALPSGWHGTHLHAVGDCSDIGVFKKSAGHVGKREGAHGLKNPDGPELGDMTNLHVPSNDAANAEFYVAGLTVKGPAEDGSVLLDANGSALIIHANEDDHVTQPIGGAGPRLACAELK